MNIVEVLEGVELDHGAILRGRALSRLSLGRPQHVDRLTTARQFSTVFRGLAEFEVELALQSKESDGFCTICLHPAGSKLIV